MTYRSLAFSLLALSLSLPLMTGCERSVGSATPLAAQELAELRADLKQSFAVEDGGDDWAEIHALLARFDKTADARLASQPHRLTLLHLACIYKKTELARCLLLDGADPNLPQLVNAAPPRDAGAEAAIQQPGNTPLAWATIPHHEDATAEEMLPLIELLVQKGADVNAPGQLGLPPLVTACLSPSRAGEAVVLRLLELGARADTVSPEGTPLPVTAFVAGNGWHRALKRLMEAGAPIATEARSALHVIAGNPEVPGALECARLLFAHGAEVDALNDEGATPLYILTHGLATSPGGEAEAQEATCALIALFLQQGADALRCCDADPELPASCPSDFLAGSPATLEKLRAMGVNVPRRRIELGASQGEAWLADICRASLFNMPGDEVKPHVGRLTSLLVTPAPELQASALYADACGHALKLLARADADAAAGTLARLPLWREVKAWQEANALSSALMRALLDTRELVMPRHLLLEHAQRLHAAGVKEVAALLVELLERDRSEGAEEAIEELCCSASPALRAGALTARLLRHGLPAPRNAAVSEWMAEHGLNAEDAAPALRRALLLTSLDSFWYGAMETAEQEALFQAMRDIGAARAAAFYAELARNLDKPEELDRLTAPGGEAEAVRYELEAATALFIWANRADFQQPAQDNGANSGVDKRDDLN